MSEGIFDPNVQLNEMMEVVSDSNLAENDISVIGDVFNGVDITKIEENKEYLLVGLLILCVIGYYTYNNILQMNDSIDLDDEKED